jgi:hypothetical protein
MSDKPPLQSNDRIDYSIPTWDRTDSVTSVPASYAIVPRRGDDVGRAGGVIHEFREARRGPQSANALRDIFCNQPPEFVVACAPVNAAWREWPQVAGS